MALVLVPRSAGSVGTSPTPMASPQQSGVSQIDYYANGLYLGFQGNSSVELSGNGIQFALAPATRPRGSAQHNGTTDPGYRVVGVRDCANVSGNQSYERLPIYELWDNNGNKPVDHFTVFEYVTNSAGQFTSLTTCPDGSNNGMTPCGYADGTDILWNTFQDDIAILNNSGSTDLQYFRYGLPGQRYWDAQIYRTLPDGSGTVQFVPNLSLTLQLTPQAEPLIQGQQAPYMGPWLDPKPSYPACNTSTPIH